MWVAPTVPTGHGGRHIHRYAACPACRCPDTEGNPTADSPQATLRATRSAANESGPGQATWARFRLGSHRVDGRWTARTPPERGSTGVRRGGAPRQPPADAFRAAAERAGRTVLEGSVWSPERTASGLECGVRRYQVGVSQPEAFRPAAGVGILRLPDVIGPPRRYWTTGDFPRG